MKRWIPLCVILILLLCCLTALNSSVVDPQDFCGEWYSAEDASVYIFENGIIECEEHYVAEIEETVFSGAYSIARGKMAVFAVGMDGVDEVRELYLVHQPGGDILCEKEDGSGHVYFYRNRSEAMNKQKSE